MYALAGLLAGFIMVPWLFICLVPIALLAGSFAIIVLGMWLLVAKLSNGIFSYSESRTVKGAKQKVLVVDDDFASVLPLIGLLEDGHADVNFVSSGVEMIEKLSEQTYDLVFLDSKMPNMTGQAALTVGDKILHLDKKQPVIFFSSFVSKLEVPSDLKHFEVRDAWKKSDLSALHQSVSALFSPQTGIVA